MLKPLKAAVKASLRLAAAQWGPHRFGGGNAAQLWVLMYHRILPQNDARHRDEEPGMIVTPASFSQQLEIVKQHFTVLPLSEWIERRAAGKSLPRRACAITFDDGWRDNFEYALPLLQQHQVPATVFAVSHMIGTRRQFWPNRLARILAAGAQLHDIVQAQWLTQMPQFRLDQLHSPEHSAALIDACKQFSDAELHERLSELEQGLHIGEPAAAALMDWEQMRTMQAGGLVEFGSHTCNHCRLVEGLPAAVAEREIVDSRARLEQQLERPVTLFCYPNGDISAAAAALVREHYRGAVTVRRGINDASTPAQTLFRIGVHEDVSNTPTRFRARLSGWV